jgi:hypothetical protein
VVIGVGQMGLEEAEHRQRNSAGLKERIDSRKSAREAGSLDAAARLVFAKLKPPNAVTEERREALFDVEPACVHLSKVLDEFCRHLPMRAYDGVKVVEKRIVREACESFHHQRLPW